MSNLRWTQEEDDRLVAIISENAGNLSNAFRLFSDEFPHRTPSAAAFRWYGVLRRRNDINICMITIDKKHKHINSKNVSSDFSSNKMRRGIWNRVLNLIFGKK